MSIHTHIHDAIARVRTEQEAVDAKLDAIDQFIDRVEDCSPVSSPVSGQSVTATVGGVSQRSHSTPDRCGTVRRAFDETIQPHSVDDIDGEESLHETITAELSESVAVALAPTTNTTFSLTVKQGVISQASARRVETETFALALEREVTQLEDAAGVVDEITEWIGTADETPLSHLGFEELQARHETLAAYRSRCAELAQHRQSFLDGVTNNGGEVGVSHRSLPEYVYQDFPVDHPVLATVARLDETCTDCQRAVRKHLTRRA
jgi:hypothetical protein